MLYYLTGPPFLPSHSQVKQIWGRVNKKKIGPVKGFKAGKADCSSASYQLRKSEEKVALSMFGT